MTSKKLTNQRHNGIKPKQAAKIIEQPYGTQTPGDIMRVPPKHNFVFKASVVLFGGHVHGWPHETETFNFFFFLHQKEWVTTERMLLKLCSLFKSCSLSHASPQHLLSTLLPSAILSLPHFSNYKTNACIRIGS